MRGSPPREFLLVRGNFSKLTLPPNPLVSGDPSGNDEHSSTNPMRGCLASLWSKNDNKASIQEEDGSDEELETRRFLLLANVHFMKSITLYH